MLNCRYNQILISNFNRNRSVIFNYNREVITASPIEVTENVAVPFPSGGVVLASSVLTVRAVGCDLFPEASLAITENVYSVLGFKFLIVMLFVVALHFSSPAVISYSVTPTLSVDAVQLN